MKEIRIIKRYQNRKLYDTFQSCYVTLEEIAQIIRDGHEIQVIDNRTKNDITYMTQIQLLFDQERKSLKNGDTELLKRVIRSPEGTLTGYIKSIETDGQSVSAESEENKDSMTDGLREKFEPFIQSSTDSPKPTVEPTSTLN